jgi:hypothetical protein
VVLLAVSVVAMTVAARRLETLLLS